MNYKNIKIFIEKNCLNKNGNINSNYIKEKDNKETLKKLLNNHWSKTISELYYCSLNNLIIKPTCECGSNLNFIKFSRGYNKKCSKLCAAKSDLRKEKIKQTNLNRYGCENVSQNNVIKEKIKQTKLKGNDNIYDFKYEKTNEKRKKTNIIKYGCEFPLQNNEIKAKMKKTNIIKYGCENVFQNVIIKEKMKETNLIKYGVLNPLQNNEIKDKIIKTNIERYEVENTSQKHIKNIENLNVEYINNNFVNDNGLLNKKDILNYFNISKSYLLPSQQNYKNKPLKNFEKLLPFEIEKNKTQNEIYNFFFNNLN
jgi:hypothetical protein